MYKFHSDKESRNSTKSNQISSPSLPGGENRGESQIGEKIGSIQSGRKRGREREQERGEVIQKEGVKWEKEKDPRKGVH